MRLSFRIYIKVRNPYFIPSKLSNQNGKQLSIAVWCSGWLSEHPAESSWNGTTPAGQSYFYAPNDASIGDVDGDGEYEIILKWDPSNAHDNSHDGYTGEVYFDCYKLNGQHLWRINLGRNIRAGAHYTQFMVFDFDGDGKAEVVMKPPTEQWTEKEKWLEMRKLTIGMNRDVFDRTGISDCLQRTDRRSDANNWLRTRKRKPDGLGRQSW